MSRSSELYRAEGISFALKGRRLLDIGSLVVEEGGICCLAGPNGAGKSLFLSLLAGLIIPDRGTVSYRGREMDAGVRKGVMGREITMVLQHPFLFRGSVIANVTYGMKKALPSRREREGEGELLLEKVGLSGFARRSAGRLSAGERARVALARALGCGARTLLFDEPTASIDGDGTALMEALIIAESETKGRTIIMSTHSREQAERLGGRMLFIREGRVFRLEAGNCPCATEHDAEGLPSSPVTSRNTCTHMRT